MAIRVLHSDAKGLFQEKIKELNQQINEFEEKLSSLKLRGLSEHTWQFSDMRYGINGLKQLRETYRDTLKEWYWEASEKEPFTIGFDGYAAKNLFDRKRLNGTVILFQNVYYLISGPYDQDEAKIVFNDWFEKKRKKIEALKSGNDEDLNSLRRERITEKVRHEVWRRDQGKCVRCGSSKNLEFDHIIPVSRGGSNTARNIQLLCESCNRRKSDSIA